MLNRGPLCSMMTIVTAWAQGVPSVEAEGNGKYLYSTFAINLVFNFAKMELDIDFSESF